MADITVSVDGDAGDVEDGADDADTHEEAADLAVDVTQVPAIVEDGGEDQRVWVDGHHKVCHCQAHHKDVPYRKHKQQRHGWPTENRLNIQLKETWSHYIQRLPNVPRFNMFSFPHLSGSLVTYYEERNEYRTNMTAWKPHHW